MEDFLISFHCCHCGIAIMFGWLPTDQYANEKENFIPKSHCHRMQEFYLRLETLLNTIALTIYYLVVLSVLFPKLYKNVFYAIDKINASILIPMA